ncbi:MAG: hypothetical protein ACLPQ6_14760 [Steroidobacteraceae bacterium]
MLRLLAWIAAGALGCAAPVSSDTTAGPVFAPLARSALVAVDGAAAAHTLLLRVRRASDQQPLTGAELSVTLDGARLAATLRPDGTWSVPLAALPAKAPGKLEIVVTHDGVREVLDGQLASVAPGGAASVPGGPAGWLSALVHKQMSWWVLNIVVVLIGVIAISRRMS